jgi:DNA (cytosine-5)-methyltransferase 1
MTIKVFDFFSGCGGTSKGFQLAGCDLVFALDCDPDSAFTYRMNFPQVRFCEERIENFSSDYLRPLIAECGSNPILLSGCAPCQPFSKQNTQRRKNDGRANLLSHFGGIVEKIRPHFVFVENVPGLQNVKGKVGPLGEFERLLDEMGYFHRRKIIASQCYGVPQLRRRMVLIASREFEIDFPEPTHGPGARNQQFPTVRQWIGDPHKLPPIAAGETCRRVANHRASALSERNLARIMSLPPEGSRKDWPEHLQLECHKNHSGHVDVYGRMKWEQPASGLTTRCNSLSNGRFGHPEQHRAISLREAACLQTFPMEFQFQGNMPSIARQIGNAVPVNLARSFGEKFISLVGAQNG